MHSTDSIKVIITGVQDETNATIMATEQGAEQAREIGKMTGSLRDYVTGTAAAVAQQDAAAQTVAAGMQSTAANIVSINDNMADISASVNRVAAAVGSTRSAARILAC